MNRRISNPGPENKEPQTSPGPSIMETPKHPPVKSEFEKYYAVAKYSKKPVPKKLLFPGLNIFMIDLPHVGSFDPRYGCKRLLSHFITTLKVVQQTISDIKKLIITMEEALTESYSRNLTPFKVTKTTENADYWRQRVILFLKQTKYLKITQLEKYDIAQENLKVLKKLLKVVNELILRPRNVCFNHQSIIRLYNSVKTETNVKLLLRIKSIDLMLSDIKIAMNFIPRLFTKPEVSAAVIENILTVLVRFRDPLTSFLPETPEAATFSDFVRSRFSPIRYVETQPDLTIENLIELTVEMMRSFAAIKDKTKTQILAALSVRYWFNRSLICEIEYKKANPALPKYLASLRNTRIGDMKPPSRFGRAIKRQLDMTVQEFLESDRLLRPAIESLFTCCFHTSPVDIAFDIHQLHLRLAGYAASLISRDINHKDTIESVVFLWRLLFVVSDLPFPDALLEFVQKYQTIAFIPPVLMERCVHPLNVIHAFKNEMIAKRFV